MSSRTRETTAGELRAWGWVRHLRSGGTTPWRAWAEPGPEGTPGGRLLPGAQQLELLRRLNLAATPSPELVGRVLGASAPGRGRPDLELEGAVERLAFGPAPVDPGTLPDDELLRVATMLLAEDLVAAGPPAVVRRQPWPWRPAYRLSGDPWLVRATRPELVRRRHPPASKPDRVLVLGADLAAMLADVWTARAFADGAEAWPAWIADLAHHDRIPSRIDLPAVADGWRPRAAQVEVVLDRSALPALVGVRRVLADPPRLGADAIELARLTVTPLSLLVTPGPGARLLRGVLLPRLLATPSAARGAPIGIHPRHADWVQQRAETMRSDLATAGYPVHGVPDALLPRASAADRSATEPDPTRVLALAVGLLLGGPPDPRSGRGDSGGRTS